MNQPKYIDVKDIPPRRYSKWHLIFQKIPLNKALELEKKEYPSAYEALFLLHGKKQFLNLYAVKRGNKGWIVNHGEDEV